MIGGGGYSTHAAVMLGKVIVELILEGTRRKHCFQNVGTFNMYSLRLFLL